jgi:2-oxo-hept-3-ene-1,7-dioate hydratase
VVEETGLGAGVLNDPVTGIVWLAARMSQYGQRIEPGQIILSGSFIRAMECPTGCRIEADFGPFGQLSCHFA